MKEAWARCLSLDTVKVGGAEVASVTNNMSVVLDCLLETWPENYRGKVDTEHDALQTKYE